ncbi:MAG: sigma-70 family RNA polymerase sigma factor [Deltaproteobacteria bacterium]|nr:sigma-70 family RNA polymerase sigma factor [Deltaproteobacteria bacterium]
MPYLKPLSRSERDAARPVAFEAEILDHLDSLFGVAMRMTRNEASAEDLVQDSIVKAVRARDQYQPGSNLKAWLLRILTNTFINRHRRGGLERDLFDGPDATPLADRWIGAATMRGMRDPEREALVPMVENEVRDALDGLPESFRLVVVLSDIEGLSYREIAETLGCPIGTVMSRLHRARKMLQEALRDQAVALGLVEDDADENARRRAAAGDPHEPVDLERYRKTRTGGTGRGDHK